MSVFIYQGTVLQIVIFGCPPFFNLKEDLQNAPHDETPPIFFPLNHLLRL